MSTIIRLDTSSSFGGISDASRGFSSGIQNGASLVSGTVLFSSAGIGPNAMLLASESFENIFASDPREYLSTHAPDHGLDAIEFPYLPRIQSSSAPVIPPHSLS